jgi:hypothetical protein
VSVFRFIFTATVHALAYALASSSVIWTSIWPKGTAVSLGHAQVLGVRMAVVSQVRSLNPLLSLELKTNGYLLDVSRCQATGLDCRCPAPARLPSGRVKNAEASKQDVSGFTITFPWCDLRRDPSNRNLQRGQPRER